MDKETRALFSRMTRGELNAEEFEELNELLRTSPEHRKEYVRYMRLESLLVTEGFQARVRDDLSRAEEEQTLHRPTLNNHRIQFAAIAGLAAAILIAASFGLAALINRSNSSSSPSVTSNVSAFRPSELIGHASIAIVQEVSDPNWDLAIDQELVPGILSLKSGEATLKFNGGAVVDLHGPAELHLLNDREATLVSGSVHVDVPRNGARFALNSPFSSHVEEHSRYSVDVDSFESVVALYEGQLVVSQLGDRGNTYCSMVLNPRERIRASAETLELLEPLPSGEGGREEAGTPLYEMSVPDHYVQLVKEDAPIIYWRFEDDAKLRNEMSDDFHALIWADGPDNSIRIEDGRAKLGKSEAARTIRMPTQIDNFLNDSFSVEIWVRPDDVDVQSILSFVPGSEDAGFEHFLVLEYAEESMMIHPRHSFRFLYRNPAARSDGVNLFTRGGQTAGTWHHLVATKNESSLQFYHNGKLVGVSGVRLNHSAEQLFMYLGQLRYRGGQRQFKGEVDELAVYTHPLTPSRVKAHFDAVEMYQSSMAQDSMAPSVEEVFPAIQ